jgi:hypothetical protein
MPPRNLLPGERLVFSRPNGFDIPAHLAGPHGPLPLEPGHWEGRQAFLSHPLRELGDYMVQSGSESIRYAVAAAPQESLLADDPRAEQQALRDLPVAMYSRAHQVTAAFAGDEQIGREFTLPLAFIALVLLFIEILFTWFSARAEQRAERSVS